MTTGQAASHSTSTGAVKMSGHRTDSSLRSPTAGTPSVFYFYELVAMLNLAYI
jgi:hypothetical protein